MGFVSRNLYESLKKHPDLSHEIRVTFLGAEEGKTTSRQRNEIGVKFKALGGDIIFERDTDIVGALGLKGIHTLARNPGVAGVYFRCEEWQLG